jgi:hypothetical protein
MILMLTSSFDTQISRKPACTRLADFFLAALLMERLHTRSSAGRGIRVMTFWLLVGLMLAGSMISSATNSVIRSSEAMES